MEEARGEAALGTKGAGRLETPRGLAAFGPCVWVWLSGLGHSRQGSSPRGTHPSTQGARTEIPVLHPQGTRFSCVDSMSSPCLLLFFSSKKPHFIFYEIR